MTSPAAEQFLAWLASSRGRAANTVAAYRRDLTAYEDFLRSRAKDADGATGDDVTAFVEHLEVSGRKPSSTARALVAVRAFHRFLVDEGGAPTDPARAVTSAPVPVVETKVLSVDEINHLMDNVTGDDAGTRRDRAILELLYGAGLRPSEVVGLDLAHVGGDGGVIVEQGEVRRRIPIGAKAADAVQRWVGGGRSLFVPDGWSGAADTGALFLNRRGHRLTRQGVWLILRRWATAAGMAEGMTPQVLRHSCAAHLAAAGMAPALVRSFLGGGPVRGRPATYEELAAAHSRFHPRAVRH